MADLFRKVVQPFVRRNRWTKSQQQQHFKRLYNTFDNQGDKYKREPIPGATDMEDVTTVSSAEFQRQAGHWNNFVYTAEPGKINRLKVWRDMSFFPDISFCLGEIEDEAINFDDQNKFISLEVTNKRLLQNENIIANLNREWNYIINDVMDANMNVNEWFSEFMIDGEIFFEKIVDPVTARDRGILRVKRLRPEYTYPIWEEIESEDVHQFIHKSDDNILIMPPEMVAYANSGIYAYEDRFTKTVLSWLERAKVDYRKLKQMEDSLVIYRMVKAPERRVFKIEVGKLPKQKAEAYTRELMRKYRQRKTYDPESGDAGAMYDPQAMIEDFFFPQQDGKGSSVETLPGGENLGQIDDVQYFRKKLFQGLRVPLSRVDEESGFSLGDTSDITRDEVRFSKMTQKYTNRFADIFTQIYMSHLRLKGYADEFNISESDIRVKLHKDNLFQEYLESNIIAIRSENLEKLMPYAEVDEEGETPLLSKKFLMKRFLKLSTEDWEENEKYLEMEEQKRLESGSSGGGEDSDLGDLGDLENLGDEGEEDLESFA